MFWGGLLRQCSRVCLPRTALRCLTWPPYCELSPATREGKQRDAELLCTSRCIANAKQKNFLQKRWHQYQVNIPTNTHGPPAMAKPVSTAMSSLAKINFLSFSPLVSHYSNSCCCCDTSWLAYRVFLHMSSFCTPLCSPDLSYFPIFCWKIFTAIILWVRLHSSHLQDIVNKNRLLLHT